MDALEILFESAVKSRDSALELRAECFEDREFLSELFIACSPLTGFLPEPVMRQQAESQQAGHMAEFPQAMRRIVSHGEADIGHVVIDWSDPANSNCVDIAIMPAAQRNGIGTLLLEAWTEVADRLNRECRLHVLADNPARLIYERMGFAPQVEADLHSPVLYLARPIRQVRA